MIDLDEFEQTTPGGIGIPRLRDGYDNASEFVDVRKVFQKF